MTAPVWCDPPTKLTLSLNELHVWRISLVQPDAVLSQLERYLEIDERKRAASFHFQTDRKRYVIARGAKRAILGRYLQCEPHEIRFTYGSHGKPRLRGEDNKLELNFNLAHSHERALLAVTRQRAVGVDLEFVRGNLSDLSFVEDVFSRRESKAYQALPAELRVKAFFNCWTRKEAFVKALGVGLSYPLQRINVSCSPGEPAKLLYVRGQPYEARRWFMKELDIGSDYASTVVVETDGGNLKLWNWRNSCPISEVQ